MIDLEQEVEMTWTTNRKFYEPLGYKYTKKNDKFLVKVKDLAVNSPKIVEVECDYCNEKYYIAYSLYNRHVRETKVNKNACSKCANLKRFESNNMLYGSNSYNTNTEKIEEIRSKFKQKNMILKTETYPITLRTVLEYRCIYHSDFLQTMTYDNFKQGHGCKYCAIEQRANIRRLDYNYVKQYFEKKNLILLDKTYQNNIIKMNYICKKHPYITQQISFSNLMNGSGCYYCSLENRSGENHHWWKGGITELSNYLREKIFDWKIYSMQICNYRCILTGNYFNDIHHLYGFDLILSEVLSITGLEIKNIIMYTPEELQYAIKVCNELHYKYGNGVCLRHREHRLFHEQYGFGDNTPAQFEEFKTRFLNGEFKDVI
jgi:hypothetical protein